MSLRWTSALRAKTPPKCGSTTSSPPPLSEFAKFSNVLERRRCTREFSQRIVPEEIIKSALDIARNAPSAGNLQAYQVVVVRDEDTRKRLAEAAGEQAFVGEAPVILVFCAEPGASIPKYGHRGATLYCVQDASIYAATTQNALEAQGVSSCWVGAFSESKVANILHCSPETLRPVVLMPCGYKKEGTKQDNIPKDRRNLESFVHYERVSEEWEKSPEE